MTRERTRRGRAVRLAVAGPLVAAGLAVAGPAGATGGGTVVVDVTDSAGRPIAGAAVDLMLSEEDPYRDGTTGASGVVTFRHVRVGRYELSAGAPGRLDSAVRLVRVRDGSTRRSSITLVRPGRITGRVTAADGSDPRRLGVSVTEAADPNLPSGDATDVAADGTWTVRNVPPGRYQVTGYDGTGRYLVQCPGGVPLDYGSAACPPSGDVTVAEGRTTTVPAQVLTHRAGGFSGRVVDAHGHPRRGAVTYVLQVGVGEVYPFGLRYPHDDTSADRTGHYRVPGLPPGTYKLLVGSDESNNWARAAYGGGHGFRTGATFRVRAGHRTTGIDVVQQRLVYLRSAPVVRRHRAVVPARVRWWGSEHPAAGRVTIAVGTRSVTRTLQRGRASAAFAGLSSGRHRLVVRYHGTAYARAGTLRRTLTVR